VLAHSPSLVYASGRLCPNNRTRLGKDSDMITGVTIRILTASDELRTYTFEAYGRDKANAIVKETYRLCAEQNAIVLGHDYGVTG
jgi:hypothetical protein